MKHYIQEEIEAGRLWRAKELLRQEIGNSDYDRELFEDYANVLAQMKDDVNAGMFYFLSGDRSPEYQEKIKLFLSVRAKKKLGSLTSQFPHSARFLKKEHFPEPIRTELFQLGLLDSPFGEESCQETKSRRTGLETWILYILSFALVCMIIGLGVVGYWTFLLIAVLVG